MSDSKNLYFIPIIAEALSQEDPEKALQSAFREIKRLGKTPEYKAGFEQFLELMNYSVKYFIEDLEGGPESLISAVYRLMHDLASGKVSCDAAEKEILLSVLKGHPKWRKEFDQIQELVGGFSTSDSGIKIEILRDDRIIGDFRASQISGSFGRIVPGLYLIRLSNGMIIWEGRLSEQDVLWTYAFPEKDLAMAAETQKREKIASKKVSMLNDELEMILFPGLESGEMTIRVKKR